ncbi:MAG: hypothetical protein JWR35_1046 [Marmoricola sp.]|nr:hypothetical protein [Marmoricola sp.]
MSGLTLIWELGGGEQGEPEQSFTGYGRELEMDLVVRSTRPERRPDDESRAFSLHDHGLNLVGEQMEPWTSPGLTEVDE